MTIRRKVFTSQKISVFFGEKEYRIQALVSSFGAKYVFQDDELADEAKGLLGQEVQVTYKNIPARCRIVRERSSAGTLYNLRFIQPSQLLLRQIERDVRESGLPSPWLRALPRLTTESKHLPAPALAVLYHRGETLFLNVKNFTVGGLLLEFIGPQLLDVELGEQFEFDLVTNFGDKIADMTAVVSNLSLEINEEAGQLSQVYFGVKFLPMSLLAKTKYRALIREHCLGLQVLPPEGLRP